MCARENEVHIWQAAKPAGLCRIVGDLERSTVLPLLPIIRKDYSTRRPVVAEIDRRWASCKLTGRAFRDPSFDHREHWLIGVTYIEADLCGLEGRCISFRGEGRHAVLDVTGALG